MKETNHNLKWLVSEICPGTSVQLFDNLSSFLLLRMSSKLHHQVDEVSQEQCVAYERNKATKAGLVH